MNIILEHQHQILDKAYLILTVPQKKWSKINLSAGMAVEMFNK
jgi:hypothetical protein